MDYDSVFTDVVGGFVMAVGLVSLTEAILQVELVGSSLPLVQRVFISLFAISFGGVLLTESASEAFKRLRLKCKDLA